MVLVRVTSPPRRFHSSWSSVRTGIVRNQLLPAKAPSMRSLRADATLVPSVVARFNLFNTSYEVTYVAFFCGNIENCKTIGFVIFHTCSRFMNRILLPDRVKPSSFASNQQYYQRVALHAQGRVRNRTGFWQKHTAAVEILREYHAVAP